MSITHRNHYVPEWYQKRFILPGQNKLHYLDLCPDKKILADGRIVTMNSHFFWAPSQCFYKEDLYTTSLFGNENDEIEKYLFGSIDITGAKALRAIVSNDIQKLHDSFSSFFEYLDAQKLRTPKGLGWINVNYPRLTQLQLMLEMQQIRQLHCTMWVEAVREIVSAEDSEIKFIITDHPVTIYNPGCSPGTKYCTYPNEPSIALKGTQTVFPLDLNHCLILTNLEYAQEPFLKDLLSNRTNARNFGQTTSRIDNWIRTRKLKDLEVKKINYILKSRASKHIAASKKEWLYPEKDIKETWQKIGQVLLPPKNELHHFGGEMYMGYKDGTVHYQDAFGRTTGDTSYLKKPIPKGKIGNNDPCVCGSGRKYKKCCLGKKPEDMPDTTEYSIRERNIIFSKILEDILGLSKGKTWEDVRKELSDEQVKKIYEAFQGLWPKDTNIINLLPHPDERISRALYAGLIDPRTAARDIISYTPYFDEILVINPFMNPAYISPEYNPINFPGQYKQEVLKNVLFFLQLMPFIEIGAVNIIPDPCSTNYRLQRQIWDLAESRHKRYKLEGFDFDLESDESIKKIFEDDFKRGMTGFSDEHLIQSIKKRLPKLPDRELGELLDYIKKERLKDPLALLQPMEDNEKSGQMTATHVTPNLELGFFIAQLTGSFIYTDSKVRWQEITRSTKASEDENKMPWEFLAKTINDIDFNLEIDPLFNFKIRKTGKLGLIRGAVRRLCTTIKNEQDAPKIKILNKSLSDEIILAHQKSEKELEAIRKDNEKQKDEISFTFKSKMTCLISVDDFFSLIPVQRLVLSYGAKPQKIVPIAVFIEHNDC
ncbi:MAG: SEC-C metal-binding domain-containing protein [Candidatus Moraniibacteriota bacterium]